MVRVVKARISGIGISLVGTLAIVTGFVTLFILLVLTQDSRVLAKCELLVWKSSLSFFSRFRI